MNAVSHAPTCTAMSSLEIADITGKLHKNVIRDIELMLSDLEIGRLKFERTYKSVQGKDVKCYNLPKKYTLCLVAKYDTKTRMAIIERWEELEEINSKMVEAIQNADPLVLRKMADLAEENQALKNRNIEENELEEEHHLYFKSVNMLSKYFKRSRREIEQIVKTNKITYIKRSIQGYTFLAYDEREVEPLLPKRYEKIIIKPIKPTKERLVKDKLPELYVMSKGKLPVRVAADYFQCHPKTVRRAVKYLPDYYIHNSTVCKSISCEDLRNPTKLIENLRS